MALIKEKDAKAVQDRLAKLANPVTLAAVQGKKVL
jgi:hypothetical protein